MRFSFRTDASVDIGTGHVMRCLSLASILRELGGECNFICRELPGNLINLIEDREFSVSRLAIKDACTLERKLGDSSFLSWLGTDQETDAIETSALLGGAPVDWLIVDHYALDFAWEQRLKAVCKKLMIIDDLANRRHDCDLLLDQNVLAGTPYAGLVPDESELLLGPKYALIQAEYPRLRDMSPRQHVEIKRVLVFLGGSDSDNQTAKVVTALQHPSLIKLEVDVVVGKNHCDPDGIEKLVNQRANTTLHSTLPSLGCLMVQADLMIGGGGSTNWERMCLGLPAVVLSIAENQTKINRALMDAGFITFVGEKDKVTSHDISKTVLECIENPERLGNQSRLMRKCVDGKGALKVAERLFSGLD